jgi:hypothetical protein
LASVAGDALSALLAVPSPDENDRIQLKESHPGSSFYLDNQIAPWIEPRLIGSIDRAFKFRRK